MGIDKLSTVYGRIVFDGDLLDVNKIVNNHYFGDSYPYLQKEMFNTCWNQTPWQYESQIISFCANYKRVCYHWTAFVIKFESLLEKINNFESALINLETFYYGTYNFKWTKTGKVSLDINGNQRKVWFCEVGHEGDFKNYKNKLSNDEIFDIGFEYPIIYNDQILDSIRVIIEKNQENSNLIYLRDHFDSSLIHSPELENVLTHLEVYNGLELGYEKEKGKWIRVNKEKNADI